MRKPSNFRETDVRRAIRSARAEGVSIARIEFDKGKIVIVAGQLEPSGKDPDGNEWDTVLGEN